MIKGEPFLCREKGSSYLPPITQFDCATNMRSLHSEACFHNPPWGCHLCALSNPYGYCRRGVLALARFSHIHLPASLPSERFCFPPLQRIASQPYYEGSDSCSAHPPSRSPRLSRHPFLPFRLQPRGLPGHRYRHASVPSEFRTSPGMSRLVAAPRRIEFVCLRT